MVSNFPKLKRPAFFFITVLLSFSPLSAQIRLSDRNEILWVPLTASIKLNKQFALHAEYQWRRADFGKTWQQSLARTGITWNQSENIAFQAGYGWILTYNYGDYPMGRFGTFEEHRLHQQVQIKSKLNDGKNELITRIRLEQRWVDNGVRILVNRIRLMQRLNIPFKISGKDFYASLMDEVFIGWGQPLGMNVFDQNRLYGLMGWKISEKFSLEAGVLNQILQQPGPVYFNRTPTPVFQYNTGLVLGLVMKL
jgi:hypothetical protein